MKMERNFRTHNLKRSLKNAESSGSAGKNRTKYVAVAVLIVIMVSAVAFTYAYTQSFFTLPKTTTQSPTPNATPSPVPTAVGSPTATVFPSSTAAATATPTPSPSPSPSPTPLQGTIVISGADALYPMVVQWSTIFNQLNPGVTFQVSAGGAGKGMTDALSGLSNIGMISRTITQTEISNGAYYVAVTDNAVVADVNSNNPVMSTLMAKGLTRQTLYNIFVAGNVTTWGQAVGTSNTTPIDVFTRSDSSGAASTWATYLGNTTQAQLIGTGVNQDTGMLTAIQGDSNAIGYNNLAYPYNPTTGQQVSGIAVVPIDVNENGVLDASENFYGSLTQLINAIQLGQYPKAATTDLYFVTLHSFTGITKIFTQWVLTNGQQYVQPAGFVPLTQDVLNQQIQKLNGSN